MSKHMKLGRRAKEAAVTHPSRLGPYVRSLEHRLSSADRELDEIRGALKGRVMVSLAPFRQDPMGALPEKTVGVTARIYEMGSLDRFVVREARSTFGLFDDRLVKFDLSAENLMRALKAVCNDLADQTGHILFSLLRNQR